MRMMIRLERSKKSPLLNLELISQFYPATLTPPVTHTFTSFITALCPFHFHTMFRRDQYSIQPMNNANYHHGEKHDYTPLS